MSDTVFHRLPDVVKRSVSDFQGYIVRNQHACRTEKGSARILIQDVAEKLRGSVTFTSKAVPLSPIADLLGIDIVPVKKIRSGGDGQLNTVNNSFRISIQAEKWPKLSSRERFTMAHEIGHIFFYRLSTDYPKRLIPKKILPKDQWREEGLCDQFASTLLVPENRISGMIASDYNIEHLLSLASDLRVAPEVLVRRLVHDLHYLPEDAIYRIWFSTNGAKVKVFRGAHRKSAYSAPSASKVTQLIAGLSKSRSVSVLKKNFNLSSHQHEFSSPAVLWFSM